MHNAKFRTTIHIVNILLMATLGLVSVYADEPIESNDDWTPVIVTIDGIDMVQVPPGCFTMGGFDDSLVPSDSRLDRPAPAHEQCFDEPFWIDKLEYVGQRSRPMIEVTWFEADDLCQERGMRLPTEAEWEYAARGPDSLVYPWGNDFDEDNANWKGFTIDSPAWGGTSPDGVSWVGALDMIGNVWEWTNSLDEDYPYVSNDGREDALFQNGYFKIVRGGSFNSEQLYLAASFRGALDPTSEYNELGFRCATSDLEVETEGSISGDINSYNADRYFGLPEEGFDMLVSNIDDLETWHISAAQQGDSSSFSRVDEVWCVIVEGTLFSGRSDYRLYTIGRWSSSWSLPNEVTFDEFNDVNCSIGRGPG